MSKEAKDKVVWIGYGFKGSREFVMCKMISKISGPHARERMFGNHFCSARPILPSYKHRISARKAAVGLTIAYNGYAPEHSQEQYKDKDALSMFFEPVWKKKKSNEHDE